MSLYIKCGPIYCIQCGYPDRFKSSEKATCITMCLVCFDGELDELNSAELQIWSAVVS